ncbi:Alpha/Beta hydrolase protein [Bisporella sp. PMI_857]|nr:Alpha/Beta hydrolase protein [Bisporella sp. PMI_857]
MSDTSLKMSSNSQPATTSSEPPHEHLAGDAKFVNIGNNHKLCLYIHGPQSPPPQPSIIIIPGLGSSTTSWAAVIRLLSPSTRVYTYDRTGYGASDSSPTPPTSSQAADELNLLLRAAGITGPFILVAHSWGGVLAREFLARSRGSVDVVGMVFVESNQERTLEVLDWRRLAFSSILQGVDREEAVGVRESRRLTDGEWEAYKTAEATERHQMQAAAEFGQYAESFPTLASKHQLSSDPPFLGDSPIYVIKGDNGMDFKKLYAAGIEKGNGTEAERKEFEDMLRTWNDKDSGLQKGNLGLSGRGRYVEVLGSGHHVQLTAPEDIVEGVRWVLEEVRSDVKS